MTGTIQHVSEGHRGAGGRSFTLVTFKMEGGGTRKTYVCQSMRNWRNWAGKLEKGNILAGLQPKGASLVDADSCPELRGKDVPPLDPQGDLFQ